MPSDNESDSDNGGGSNSTKTDKQTKSKSFANNSRKGYRSATTRLVNELIQILNSDNPSINLIEGKIIALTKSRDKLVQLDVECQSLITDDDEFEIDFQESLSRLEIIDNQINIAQKIVDGESKSRISNNNEGTHNSQPFHSYHQLPKLNLPTFDGNCLEFESFYDIFTSAIHSESKLTSVQKFAYLKSQLKGEAGKLLEGFKLTSIGYDEAIKLLVETYGNTGYIVESHIKNLVDLVKPNANHSELSQFRASMESHVRGLSSLGYDVYSETSSVILATILINKIPQNVRSQMERTKTDNVWSLSELRTALNREINFIKNEEKEIETKSDFKPNNTQSNNNSKSFLNKVKSNSNSNSNNNNANNNKSTPKPSIGTVNTFSVNNSNNNNNNNKGAKPRTLLCKFCAGAHYASNCNKYCTVPERKKRVADLNICIHCLSNSHFEKDCTFIKKCFICQGKHNTALCSNDKTNSEQSSPIANQNSTNENPAPSTSNLTAVSTLCTSNSAGVALPTANLNLNINNEIKKARAIFDSASQRTFALTSLANTLGMTPIKAISLSVNGFNAQGPKQMYDVVNIAVKTPSEIINIEALLVDKLPTNVCMPGVEQAVQTLKRFKIKLADPYVKDNVKNIQILIGADQYPKFVNNLETINEINVINSKLGYMVWGSLPFEGKSNEVHSNIITVLRVDVQSNQNLIYPSTSNNLQHDLDRIWSLDSIGISLNEISPIDKKIMNNFEQNLEFKDGHYIAKLPWKQDHPPLPNNYALSKSRLFGTIKKLNQTPELLECYNSILSDQLERDFIEEVSPKTLIHPNSKLHYLPHSAVKKESDTTPLRIVYDCSSGKPSLNDCLWSGPCLITDLCKLLVKFRMKKYCCTSDIEKSYLQIGLSESDRDSTRFLWLKDPFNINSQIITFRFKVVLFGSTCSQFLLSACLKHHLENSDVLFAQKILSDIYVDNIISTFNYENEIGEYFQQINKTMNDAGFTLREWSSNSEVACTIFENNKCNAKNNNVKILGMNWDTVNDTVSYPSRFVDPNANTKRSILKATATVFDPVGYINPITIRARIFLQQLWKCKLNWDQIIHEDLQSLWKIIAEDVQQALSFTLPRQLIFNNNVILHAFCDASSKAYGSCIYIISNNISNLIMSKSKVAPVKELTIPKLELTAATLAARLITYVIDAYKNELTFLEIHAWSDSQVVLQYLKSNKPQKQYVQNRVDEINKLVPDVSWHYVPSNDNPSDILSRGITYKKFVNNDLWIHGPDWLQAPDNWPVWNPTEVEISEQVQVNAVHVEHNAKPQMTSLFELINYSSYNKVIKITMLVFRFINNVKNKTNLKSKVKMSKSQNVIQHNFSLEEKQQAEHYWIKFSQDQVYFEEIYILKNHKRTKSPRILSLNLFLDNEILRCKKRIDNALLPFDTKFPILLPNNHYFTNLLIFNTHLINHHVNISQLIILLQNKFHIPKMRQTIKKVIHPCVLCKRLQGVHYSIPPAPPLPKDRVTQARPFSVTGLDYTGALFVRNKNKNLSKVYIVLFSCAVTRAVHLEIVEDNTKESFLFALRRFVSRRGAPTKIISDNATTFVSAASYFQNIQTLPSVQQFLLNRSIKWMFIPSRSPHFGGLYERLIGIIKSVLKKTLGQSLVTKEELQTIVAEVELCVNTRPLTHVGDELTDDNALTPSKLLVGYNLNGIPIPMELLDPDEDYNSKSFLTKRHKYVLKLLEDFWKKWNFEYLTTLRQNNKNNGIPHIKIGDIVLIYDESPRLKWKMGRVTQLHVGADKLVRSASLQTANGETSRAIVKLYPLEINDSEVKDQPLLTTNDNNSVRPQRKAAVKAKAQVSDWVRQLL